RREIRREFARREGFKFRSFGGICSLVRFETRFPFLLFVVAFFQLLTEVFDSFFGKIKLLFGRPAERFLRREQFVFTERAAVRGEVVVLLRAAETDVGADQNQRGLFRLRLRFIDGLADRGGVVAVRNMDGLPAESFEALADIFRKTKIGAAGERDAVLVVEKDQLAKLQMS